MAWRRTRKADIRTAPRKTVKVEQKHIDQADSRKSRTCAIAAALAEQGVLRPEVSRGKVSFTINGERFKYIVPPQMHVFLQKFDDGGAAAVEPSTFYLYEGLVNKAKRTGGPDRTEAARHAPGGRAARPGYAGPKHVLSTSDRLSGFPVVKKIK